MLPAVGHCTLRQEVGKGLCVCVYWGEIVTQLPPEGFLASFLHHCWRPHGELDASLTLYFIYSCVPYTQVLEMLQPLFLTSQFLQGIESCCVGLSGGSGDSPNLLGRTQISSSLMKEQSCKQHCKFAACFGKVPCTDSLEQGGVFCSGWLVCALLRLALINGNLVLPVVKYWKMTEFSRAVLIWEVRTLTMNYCTWCKDGVTSTGAQSLRSWAESPSSHPADLTSF